MIRAQACATLSYAIIDHVLVPLVTSDTAAATAAAQEATVEDRAAAVGKCTTAERSLVIFKDG
jgi:hypothetical protein